MPQWHPHSTQKEAREHHNADASLAGEKPVLCTSRDRHHSLLEPNASSRRQRHPSGRERREHCPPNVSYDPNLTGPTTYEYCLLSVPSPPLARSMLKT